MRPSPSPRPLCASLLAAAFTLTACPDQPTPQDPPAETDAGIATDAGQKPPVVRPDAGTPARTFELDGVNEFLPEEKLPTSNGKQLYFSWDDERLFIGFEKEDLRADNKALFVAIDIDGETGGSRIAPFAQWFEGSTTFLPIDADLLFFTKTFQGKSERYRREYTAPAWSARTDASAEMDCVLGTEFTECAIQRSALGTATNIRVAIWTKDLASAANPGWGWTFGTTDREFTDGIGDKVLTRFHAFDLSEPRAESQPQRRVTGRENARIYQLLVRLFGNRNATRKVNGTLAENGVGKFADLDAKAIGGLKELGVTHLWLTGVLQQATATDYAAHGQPADDPDLVKGLAGSPYAIRDYFDVSPDYATDPAKRLEEFEALVQRVHGQGLKVLIDLVPNHVARSYGSDIEPGQNFGTKGRGGAGDDTTKFFDPQNNFFYLEQGLTLPGAESGTCQLGTPPLLVACDGKFAPESGVAKVTGNNVTSPSPSLGDWYETVKLNFGFDFTTGERSHPRDDAPDAAIPDTWLKLDAVVAYWQQKGVDGFRVDMSHMVPHQFWQWLISRARARDAKVLFVGEAYETDPASTTANVLQFLLHSGFDAVYDDDTYDALKEVYDGSRWANDLDALLAANARNHGSLRYGENHDEVRLASSGNWGSAGMEVGRAVTGLLFGLSRGPVMLYSGQEVGEPAAGREGFGGDDGRTSIFDYWSMPELQKWVNGGAYDGGQLSAAQKALRGFYARLVALRTHPAIADGELILLNGANNASANFGRVAGDGASGHWMYAYLRHTGEKRLLVVVNLHATETFRNVRIKVPETALRAMGIPVEGSEALAKGWRLVDTLDVKGSGAPLQVNTTTQQLIGDGLELKEIAPLTPMYLELTAVP